MNEKVDEVHKKALMEIIDNPDLKWSEKWDKIVKYKKENMGLKGFHVDIIPIEKFDPIQNKIVYENPGVEAVGHDLCMMEKASLEGKMKEITGSELDML